MAVIALAVVPTFAGKGKPGRDAVTCARAQPYEGASLGESIPQEAWAAAKGDLLGTLPAETAASLQRTLDRLTAETGLDRYSIAVGVPGRGIWSAERADPAGPETWFFWASVGKLFTAVAILQLVEEERIALTDPLADWYPEFPNAASITVDHLLSHTNGTFSFNEDKKFRKLQGYKHPDQLMELAARHGSRFCPGQNWAYSNTGYLLLSRILEQETRQPYHKAIQARLLKPLGLTRLRALAPQEVPQGLVLPPGNRHGDLETFDYSTPMGAGSLVGGADEMVRFLAALLSGSLLKPATLETMLAHLYPMFGGPTYYGRGMMVYDVPDQDGSIHRWIGHSGGTPGYKAIVAFDLQTSAFAAVSLPTDLPAEAMAHAMFQTLAAVAGDPAPVESTPKDPRPPDGQPTDLKSTKPNEDLPDETSR